LTFVAVSLNAAPGSKTSLSDWISIVLIFKTFFLAALVYILPPSRLKFPAAAALAEVEIGSSKEQEYPSFNWPKYGFHDTRIQYGGIDKVFSSDMVPFPPQLPSKRVMALTLIRHVARHDQPTPEDANVPDFIQHLWRADLALIFPIQLDLPPRRERAPALCSTCFRCSKDPGMPTAPKLLSYAKVWLEFEDPTMTTPVGTPFANLNTCFACAQRRFANQSRWRA